eukprot:403331190
MNVLSPRQQQKLNSDFEQMLLDVRSRLEEKLKQFKEKQLSMNQKQSAKELLELQQLAVQYKKMMESKDQHPITDLDQLNQAEKELSHSLKDHQSSHQDLQELRQKLLSMQSEQRQLDWDIQIEDMRRQILEKLKTLKEQILRSKASISDQGQLKVQRDLAEQISLLQKYLQQIDGLEKQTIVQIKQELSRKAQRDSEEEQARVKQEIQQQNEQKRQQIKKMNEDIEQQRKKNQGQESDIEGNKIKIEELKEQLEKIQQQKRDLIADKEREISLVKQEQQEIESQKFKQEEQNLAIQQEISQAQRELKQTQLLNSYLTHERQVIENFNKSNPQVQYLQNLLDQVKQKTASLQQETLNLTEDWERKKLRIESDQISEVNSMNQKLIAKLTLEIDKLIKEKEGETQKLRLKQQSLEQTRSQQQTLVDQEQIQNLKNEYIQKYQSYKQAFTDKAALYQQIADQTQQILQNNNEYILRECQHSKKQLEKEIAKVTVENNEDQLRIIEDKLQKAKQIEDAYLQQFGIYDRQIQDLRLKLQDREEDINQLEEILEDKDKYIDELRKEIEIQQAMKKRIQVIVPAKKQPPPEAKSGFQFPMKRLRQGEYLFAGKVINAKVSNGKLLFRTGGGYIMFDEFLHQYAKEQVKELRAFAENEGLTLEEVLTKFEQHYIEEYSQGQNGMGGLGMMTTQMAKSSLRGNNNRNDASSRSPIRDR